MDVVVSVTEEDVAVVVVVVAAVVDEVVLVTVEVVGVVVEAPPTVEALVTSRARSRLFKSSTLPHTHFFEVRC